MDYAVRVSVRFAAARDADADDFGRHVDRVAEQFGKTGTGDLVTSATLTQLAADFSTVVPGDDADAVLHRFLGDLFAALHAAGYGVFVPFDQEFREIRELQSA